ncbi:MAG: TraR/DksA family transcriptional regulator [Phycisphaerales bacterium]|nr:TraR/DksA family transcriptional regulator [Phycisphaerales bacterium]
MAKKVSKASTAKKKAARKKPAKKKAAKKKPAKKKAATKKASSKKTTSKKTATKKAVAKKTATKTAAPTTPRRGRRRTVLEAAAVGDADKDGYVIINGRRVRRIAIDRDQISSRKKTATKATTAKAAKAPKRAKSRLKSEDLDAFRDLLLQKRQEVLSALDSLETEALRSDSGESSSMPIHMADVGSDAYEQDLKLGISASERERIMEIDAALQRIVEGSYGICERSGKAIRKARLKAKPWARWTIDTARENERTGRRR